MNNTQTAITILSVLDLSILVLAHSVDRQLYRQRTLQKSGAGHFFCNPDYDERVNRFLLSRGGLLLTGLLFITIFLYYLSDAQI
ncbi:hypothetical protein [Mucilaginibacter gracilis]|uniref:hypothetical protein n=1 Tax=Mucilaginibacter gracilis TaxID=423350 RepID=UPI0011C45A70|nr:hypothetical protein [Mucilaginibacter gracilis]